MLPPLSILAKDSAHTFDGRVLQKLRNGLAAYAELVRRKHACVRDMLAQRSRIRVERLLDHIDRAAAPIAPDSENRSVAAARSAGTVTKRLAINVGFIRLQRRAGVRHKALGSEREIDVAAGDARSVVTKAEGALVSRGITTREAGASAFGHYIGTFEYAPDGHAQLLPSVLGLEESIAVAARFFQFKPGLIGYHAAIEVDADIRSANRTKVVADLVIVKTTLSARSASRRAPLLNVVAHDHSGPTGSFGRMDGAKA